VPPRPILWAVSGRLWILALLVALAACGSSAAKTPTTSIATTSAAGAPARPTATHCGPASAKTLAGNGRVRVYVTHEDVYGCSVARGRSFHLGHGMRAIDQPQVGPVTVAGNLAGYGLVSFGVDTVRASVVVRRLTDGAELRNLPALRAVAAESFQSIGSLVLAPGGAVAWIGAESSIGGRHGHVIEVHAAAAGGDRVLDSGSRIDPASLRLHGSTLTWTNGGTARHAALR
jgi:hypothetical protein